MAKNRERLELDCPMASTCARRVGPQYVTARQQLTAPPTWRNGKRFRVRLQIFPDGRCGAAIDGRAVANADAGRSTPNGTALVYLYGNSPNTRMLVGTVVVTEGVPEGVDWFAVDGAARVAGAARPKGLQGRRE